MFEKTFIGDIGRSRVVQLILTWLLYLRAWQRIEIAFGRNKREFPRDNLDTSLPGIEVG